ncbi:MAG TPA: signal peptidase I [Candidatus Limnocylindrales bacterium]|nr:signal peptidase I [Candidatus Limnocylindrales bacterium]
MTSTRTRLWRRGVSPLGVLVFAVMVPLVMMTVAAFLFGWRFQPVESGSMAPRFPVGSLAVVEPVDPADVEAGTVIVFIDPSDRSRLIAHRAVKQLDTDPPAWQTQGDANAGVDAFPVASRDIVGRVRWVIPGLGAIVTAVRGPQAVLLLVGLPLAVLVLLELLALRRPPPEESQLVGGQ